MYELCEKLEAKGRGGAEGELGRGGDVVGGVGLERMSGGRAGRGNGCGGGRAQPLVNHPIHLS